jgi:hypothetical protein
VYVLILVNPRPAHRPLHRARRPAADGAVGASPNRRAASRAMMWRRLRKRMRRWMIRMRRPGMSEAGWAALTEQDTVLLLAALAVYFGGVVGFARNLPRVLRRSKTK